ncbi:MAG: hypothetical protein A3F04_00210 [Candidatus Chisholmbacteria bacterium RIFCSPHIGHO2_12_FULL_49_9]|uniref:Fido domain-containing protein n=1 Tax=Candidatus Chisholmbacteria bacterium RIFCSPHIGHO2_01_FULL_52_32 TaxID=1797591 RepID=A0A1G1VSB3_9BACT|nr:MAG: hypothetical protein A2786_02050 [Candidatus Chisholmbacteria bacterium RIFCSPHIGHO2_01_FULL_52_32]OGY19138.1 MAG: hypothetical protein A3F04_00210 [Candidatus Chisholmbacteria bacterium RIFCSPHIGHO2_12_FULL_49_9]OGY20345.1 MAG: hypothetical protein A2900_04695 [Candidatus Chisholmbacteria bacterium RIFCSPLOWO2_01_FULL_50_28]
MDQSPLFLTLEQVLAIHDDQIERYGGSHGVRDLSLLLSAIARPQATFGGEDLYPHIFLKAAVLMQGIILNHPFVDGNKRTGVVSAARFLFVNGYQFHASGAALIQMALKVEAKTISPEELVGWLQKNSRKMRRRYLTVNQT